MIGMRRNNNISDALIALAPKAAWTIRENDYDTIEWYSEDIPKPTKKEVEDKVQELIAEEPYTVVREIRDWYLQQSDWTQAQDVRSLKGPEWCEAWDNYRQELRDLPSTLIDPHFDENNNIVGVTFPEKPNI